MRLPEASNTAAAGIGKEEGGMEIEEGGMERGEEDGGSEEITVRPPPPALAVSHERQEEDWRSGTSEFLANSEAGGRNVPRVANSRRWPAWNWTRIPVFIT
jgi:hypothetical protein